VQWLRGVGFGRPPESRPVYDGDLMDEETGPDDDPAGGASTLLTAPMMPCGPGCRSWPNPHFGKGLYPCAHLFTAEQLQCELDLANDMAFDETARRYPGCCCIAQLRPCKPCGCPCSCGCERNGLELRDPMSGGVGYPILELIDVRVNGVSVGTSGWSIEDYHLLVNHQGMYPLQDPNAVNGSPCTWSVIVRYGAAPPPVVLRWRDMMWWSQVLKHYGSSFCKVKGKVTSYNDGVRTYTIDQRDIDRVGAHVMRYHRSGSTSRILDPDEARYTGRVFIESNWNPATDPLFPPNTPAGGPWSPPPVCDDIGPIVPPDPPVPPAEPLTAGAGGGGVVTVDPVTGK